jgi:glutamate 5-kinase
MTITHTASGNSILLIKIGSSTLTLAGDPNQLLIARLCDDLHALRAMGMRPVLVTSGAVQLGRCENESNAGATATIACRAAIGQIRLVAAFSEHLSVPLPS